MVVGLQKGTEGKIVDKISGKAPCTLAIIWKDAKFFQRGKQSFFSYFFSKRPTKGEIVDKISRKNPLPEWQIWEGCIPAGTHIFVFFSVWKRTKCDFRQNLRENPYLP